MMGAAWLLRRLVASIAIIFAVVTFVFILILAASPGRRRYRGDGPLHAAARRCRAAARFSPRARARHLSSGAGESPVRRDHRQRDPVHLFPAHVLAGVAPPPDLRRKAAVVSGGRRERPGPLSS